ncbi:uncharacterized protein VTP21DRAFT_8723 [Calcarisporiella thermophila]|uniref:uncharacterized protein n=1 Tax=Calcarisporiella thermophila TaxID=911321 RepID=UPI00374450EA
MDNILKDRPDLDLDNQTQQGFCAFFRGLPQKPENTIRLFERNSGDFYSFHGEDAKYIAQNVYKTNSAIKYLGGDMKTGIPSCTLSRSNTESFLRDALLKKQLRVEIFAAEPRKNNAWKVIKRASPGNLQDMEDLLFTNSDMQTSPIVLAVKLGTSGDQKVVGVAFADASIREFGVAEFIDNELYSNFESLVIQLGVKECIIPLDESHKDYELTKLKGVLERCGIVITERKKGDFNVKDIEQDLNRLLEGDTPANTLPEYELKNAMAATACLIKYLSLMSDETNFGHFTLIHHDLSQYMKLDASALRALNLMPSPQDGAHRTMSLFGLLNKCKTAQGTRLLGQWLKQPLVRVEDIEKRQNLVEAFTEDTEMRQSLQEDNLKAIPDLHRLAKRFQRGIASLQDIVRIYQVVIRLPGLQATLEACSTGNDSHRKLIDEVYCSNLRDYMKNLEKLQELVETTIDLQAVEDHEFLIKADFDDSLKELKSKIDEIRSMMTDEHERVGRRLGMDTEKKLKLEKQNVYGFCFRVSRQDAGIIRNTSGYLELATQKAGVYFATPRLRELSSDFNDYSAQYEKKQADLVKEVINIVASYCPILETLGNLIAHLDVIVSFAHVAVHAPIPYVRPKMHPKGEGDVILKSARHPCLEVQDDVSFIPNDVQIERNKSEFQIITGPNMGGKSTYIRQIGVIALMAQTGCFVPCSEASLCVFDCILARVGAGDSQLKGVSTFMAEMLETATILKSATANSLIIIDELGRGTSTYDGFGLAWAISEYIATQIGAICLFATHFHELTTLNQKVPHVRNLHVAVHVQEGREITLLYRVQDGVCDQSFGIHVAELANFPETVVKLAKRKASELEDFTGEGVQPTKCSAEEITAGEEVIKKCLSDFTNTPGLDSMGHGELLEVVRRVKRKYERDIGESAYVQEILGAL